MQFEIANQKALLSSFNCRSEIHGEDRAPAADIKFNFTLGLDALAMFGPELRASWYDEDGATPRLRNPKLVGPFDWDDEIVGATLTIHHGLGGKSDLVIGGVGVNAFKVMPQDGGSVLVSTRCQCKPDEKQAGKLYAMVQTDCEISIAPAQSSLDLAPK